MKPFYWALLTQVPFLLYMALVPPERRMLPRRQRWALGASLSLGAIGWGAWLLHRETASEGKFWIGLGLFFLVLTFAPLPRWLRSGEDEVY